MDVCLRESSSAGGSLRKPLDTTSNYPTDLSVIDLKTSLNEILVKDGSVDVKFSGENNTSSETREGNNKKRLNKCATIPLAREHKSSVDGFLCKEKQGVIDVLSEEKENSSVYSVSQSCQRSISLPTPRKLVSAMKGSREKHGITLPDKLSITWAPDVYDPIPSSVSHVPSNKNQRYRSDCKRKNKQKRSGKSSRQGREKKETRKIVGTPHKPKHHIRNEGCEIARAAESASGQPNSSCGSSFLKDSVTNLHFSVAEAT